MLGEKIAIYREKNNLSQTQLAKHLGVSRACISQWELNKRTPNIYDCKKISRVLNVSVIDLIGDEFDMKQNEVQSHYTEQQKNCIDMLMQLTQKQLDRVEAYLTAQIDAKEEIKKEIK